MLARWSLGLAGRVDERERYAVVGMTREMPANVAVENACRLGGDYAFIGAHPKGLLLARGQHAGRCLYYAMLPGGAVAACSRLAPLVQCLSGGVAPNVGTLAALMLGQPSEDYSATVFHEVRRVESSQAILLTPAGILECDRAKLEVTSRDGSPDELAEEIRALLDRSIRRSIQSTRRVAVLVSGGLDSTSVLARAVAIARGASRAEVDAVTWNFAGPGDDRPYLKELCEKLGIVPLRVSSADVSALVIRSLVADAAPTIWPTLAGLLLPQERARERGAEVLLTGLGGDQVFNGDPRTFARYALEGHWRNAIRSGSRFYEESRAWSVFRTARLLLASPLASSIPANWRLRRRRYAARRWPWAGPRLRQVVMRTCVGVPHKSDWMNLTSEVKFQRFVSRDFLHVSETRGQMEAITGLMRVDPLLDDELVTTVAGFPQSALLFDHRSRGLLRHAMRQTLPDRLRLRPDKANFEPAVAESIQLSDLSELRALAQMRMCGELGLVDPYLYIRHFETALAEGCHTRQWAALWPALTVEAFVRAQWGRQLDEKPCRTCP